MIFFSIAVDEEEWRIGFTHLTNGNSKKGSIDLI